MVHLQRYRLSRYILLISALALAPAQYYISAALVRQLGLDPTIGYLSLLGWVGMSVGLALRL